MRRLIVLVTVAAAAMAIAGCSESDNGRPTSTTTTVVDRDVTATVSGRTIFGHCTGVATDAPTVVLEVGHGRTSLGARQHFYPFPGTHPGLHL